MNKDEAYRWFNLGKAYAYSCEYTMSVKESLQSHEHKDDFEREWKKGG